MKKIKSLQIIETIKTTNIKCKIKKNIDIFVAKLPYA